MWCNRNILWRQVENKEYIEYRFMCTNGHLYAPTFWLWATNNYVWCNWNISVDWLNVRHYQLGWQYTRSDIDLWDTYTTWQSYVIKIQPAGTLDYWWARAYWWDGSAYKANLLEIIYDDCDMWYLLSATDTWIRYRMNLYKWCTSLLKTAYHSIPSTVTTIWDNCFAEEYNWCTYLDSILDEVIPDWVLTIGNNFKKQQFINCTFLDKPQKENMPNTITSIWDGFMESMYQDCSKLDSVSKEAFSTWLMSLWNNFRYQQYSWTNVKKAAQEVLEWQIQSIWDNFRAAMYWKCRKLEKCYDEVLPNTVQTIWDYFRQWQYNGCYKLSEPAEEAMWNNITSVWNSFRQAQYTNAWIIHAVDEVCSTSLATIGNNFRHTQYAACVNTWTNIQSINFTLLSWWKEAMPDNVTSCWDNFRYQQYSGNENMTVASTEEKWWFVTIWNYFRAGQYQNCWILSQLITEYIWTPTTIWDNFRDSQYYMFWTTTYLRTTANNEVLPNSVTSIWSDFRRRQYAWIRSLIHQWTEVISNSLTSIWGNFRREQYRATWLTWCILQPLYSNIYPSRPNSNWRNGQFAECSIAIARILWPTVDQAEYPFSQDPTVSISVPSQFLATYQADYQYWASSPNVFVWY